MQYFMIHPYLFLVSCKECLKSYFEVQIVDGAVNALSCPEDKCTSQASPGQVGFTTLYMYSYLT